jgi:hypothetical protein
MYLLQFHTYGSPNKKEIATREDISDLISVAEHHAGVPRLMWEDYEDGIFGRISDNSDDHYLITWLPK